MLQGAKLQDILVFISILCWGIKLWLTRRRIIELTLVSCYPFLPGSDFIFYYSLQDEETRFCARFQTIVDLGAIKLLKKWNAEIKRCEMLKHLFFILMLPCLSHRLLRGLIIKLGFIERPLRFHFHFFLSLSVLFTMFLCM